LSRSPEPYIRQAAERSLAQLDALDAIDDLQARVDRSRAILGRDPADWGDVVRAGQLAGIPADQTGTPFIYEPASHTVTLGPQSSLSPLPPRFAHR